jgi:hypothetical protein
MLVWKAMPSITPMISAILRDDAEMPVMVVTTWPTAAPPSRATAAALAASSFATRALSAFWPTVEVSSSIELAVSSSVLACSSVRCDRSALPCAICALVSATLRAPCATSATSVRRRDVMSPRARSSCVISSRPPAASDTVRSPSATRRAASTAWSRGRVMERAISQEASSASSAPARQKPTSSARPVRALVAAAAASCSTSAV